MQGRRPALPAASPPPSISAPERRRINRRSMLKLGFWTSLGLAVASAVGGVLNLLYPRGVSGFGGPIAVDARWIPRPGDPPKEHVLGRFFLVNLEPGEGLPAGASLPSPGGLVALWTRCPHLGCAVPWRQDFVFADRTGRRGWFVCPCHGSTYTRAGVRVRGPATRSMDTMAIEMEADGSLIVQTGRITQGGDDNAGRAVP
jgi:cytochrome b6-f complex iron-sulfur subunit